MNHMVSKKAIRDPKTITVRTASASEPEQTILFYNIRIMQPSSLPEMVSCRTGNGIKLPGPGNVRHEFSNYVSYRSLLNMLSKCPPSIIVNLFNFLVRTVQEWNIIREESPAFFVGNHFRFRYYIKMKIESIFFIKLVYVV